MKHGTKSKTADAVAAIRANHFAFDSPIVFSDPWAIQLTSAAWRIICRTKPLSWLVFKKIFGALRPVQANVLCRARYIEDRLAQALALGVTDYIILGAGLDSFALRRLDAMPQLHVWEVDLPATQNDKLQKLMRLGVEVNKRLHFVSTDFENELLSDVLARAGLPHTRRSFFSLLGVSYYLTADALLGVIKNIGEYSYTDVDLVIDIRVPKALIEKRYLATFEKTERYVAKRGETMVTSFAPDDFQKKVYDIGFDTCERLSPADQRERYFSGTLDDLLPSPEIYLFHLRKRNKESAAH